MGGCPSLASKNLSHPLEPKVRNYSKKFDQEKEVKFWFLNLNLKIKIKPYFLSEELVFYFKKLVFLSLFFSQISQFSLSKFLFVSPFPSSIPPLGRQKVSPPLRREIFGGITIFGLFSPPQEKNRRPCVPVPIYHDHPPPPFVTL